MLKKTTVYLGPEDVLLLHKIANNRNVIVAETIHISIQEACRLQTPEGKTVWDALDKIWEKREDIFPDKMKKSIDQAVKEVRSAKKKRRPS